ncbi:alanine racemase [soil metagenome]
MIFPARPTLAEIDLDNLRFNFRSCRNFIGRDVKIMAVVKANAYGHGAVECSRVLEKQGVNWLGVATPEEALELRNAEITTNILCLGGFWPGQEKILLDNKITPAIYEISSAANLNSVAKSADRVFPVHIKIDTGMGRLGIRWDSTAAFIDEFTRFEHLTVEGLMTHFASADNPSEHEFTSLQVLRFQDSLSDFRAAGHSPEFLDLSNSPGAVVTGANGGNMVRLGGVLYGLGGDILPAGASKPELKPIMSIKSRISHLKTVSPRDSVGYGRTYVTERESIIAAIPIGYHDGYRRGLSNKAVMIVHGCPVPVVGLISMDWTTIDVTDIRGVSLGDEVTIIGRQGDETILAEELAGLIESISYEITCGISGRVPRRFLREETDYPPVDRSTIETVRI